MSAKTLRTVSSHIVGWCVIASFVLLLTFIFSFLGSLFCSVLAGMMLGAMKPHRWYSVPISLLFPMAIFLVLRAMKVELAERQINLVSLLCLGAFWLAFLLAAVLVSAEQKARSARVAGERAAPDGAIEPAGQVMPGPKTRTGEDNANAPGFEDWIPEVEWTDGMAAIAGFAQRVAEKVLSRRIVVKFCATGHHLGGASYGSGELVFNRFRLGNDWFEHGVTEDVVRLLIHEFGHEYSPDHLSSEYHEALCEIGARMFLLARQVELR